MDASNSSNSSSVQVIVKFTTGSQSVFLCQWHHHSIADLLAAIRTQYSHLDQANPSSSTTPASARAPLPVDRVLFKLIHAGSVLAPDSQPLAHIKRQLLVTHSPFLASQAITLPLPSATSVASSPPPVPPLPNFRPPSQPEPAALFSLNDDDDDDDDDAPADADDENAPLNPERPLTQPAAGVGGVSPRPVNERLPLLRATAASVSVCPSPMHLSSSLRASPDSANLIETVVVLCSISEAPSDRDSPSASAEQQQSPTTSASDTPRGFDALLTQGFSSADIHAFRRTFHQARGTSSASETDRLRLEDAWVAGDHANDQSHVAATEQSSVKALVKGAALGYFLGVPMVLGVKEAASLDRRVVVGAVLGLVVNFGVGLLLWINQG